MHPLASSSVITRHKFAEVRENIENALEAYTNTALAKRRGALKRSPPLTYDQLIDYPLLAPETFSSDDFAELVLGRGPLEEFMTTGTRGHSRSILWPKNRAASVHSLLQKVGSRGRITAIHSTAVVETDVFLKAHLSGFAKEQPGVRVKQFSSAIDAADIINESDAIIIVDYPSALARFLRLSADALSVGAVDRNTLNGKKIIARLTGEPMSGDDLGLWSIFAQEIGFDIAIEIRYGCTELLGIGKADFDPNIGAVEYRLTNEDCFIEVLHPKVLRPVYEGEGIICATSYRTSGTILFRYLLGDHVSIFERDGERFVRNVGRPDTLIVTGNTISLSDFVTRARKAISLEICLEIKKHVDRLSGVQSVDVEVLVPSNRATELELARRDIEQRLLDELKIRPAVAAGFVALKVRARKLGLPGERRHKAWRISY